MTISVFGSDVVAATHARHLYIRADAKATAWIHTLHCAVKQYTDDALRAESRITTKADDDLDIPMPVFRIGVRNKVTWKSQKNTWDLNVTPDDGSHITYMNTRGISLDVAQYLTAEEFSLARDHTFVEACRVWNAVDDSKRMRIAAPQRKLNVEIVPVSEDDAISPNESDSDDPDAIAA